MTATLVPPMDWETSLGAQALRGPQLLNAAAPFQVGMFRFDELPEPFTCPEVDHHYISFTVNGRPTVERRGPDGVHRGELRSGMSLIMAAGSPNTWTWDRATDELHLWMRPSYLTDVAAEAGLAAPRLIERFPFTDEPLRLMVLAVFTELRLPGRAPGIFADVAAAAIAGRLIDRHCEVHTAAPVAAGLSPRQLRRVTALMLDGLGRDLRLDEIAAEAGLSRAHFSRAFHRATGSPPHRWLVERRIERARELLHHSQLSVGEVGAAVGYPGQSHFTAVFRRHAGTTPAAYRRLVQT